MSRRDFPGLPAEIPLTDESGRPTVIEARMGTPTRTILPSQPGRPLPDIGTRAAPGSRDIGPPPQARQGTSG
jgi:hypothetical protein